MMDEEDGNSQTPPEKFFTISLEPINETPIIKVNHDGIEEIKKEVDLDEKFASLVSTLDFEKIANRKKDTKVEQESDQDKEPTPPTPQWPWEKVVKNLSQSQAALENLMLLLNKIKDQTLSCQLVFGVTPTNPKEDVFKEMAKRKQLKRCATLLSEGAAHFKNIISKEKTYFDDLIEIRKHWLISRKVNFKLVVDYSYRTAGSNVKGEVEIIQMPSTGNANTLLPASQKIFKPLHVTNSTSSNSSHFHLQLLGKHSSSFQQHLANAQLLLFNNELFDLFSQELQQPNNNLSGVQIFHSSLSIQHDTNNILLIEFKKILESDKQTTKNFANKECQYSVLELFLHQLLKYKHYQNIKQFKNQITNKPKQEGPNLLYKLKLQYSHLCVCNNVKSILDQIAGNIFGFSIKSCKNEIPTITSFDLLFNQSLLVSVLIENGSIFLFGIKNPVIHTPEEMGNIILLQLASKIIVEVKPYFEKHQNIHWDKFLVGIIYPLKTVSISLVPNLSTFDIEIEYSESKINSEEYTRVLHWNQLAGIKLSQKLEFLISHSKTHSLLSPLHSTQNQMQEAELNLKKRKEEEINGKEEEINGKEELIEKEEEEREIKKSRKRKRT